MFKIRLLFVGLSIILMLGGCRFQKLLKSSDYEAKYAMAIEFYEQKDYSRALQLMDQIVPIFKGTDKAQDLEYMYAMSYFKQNDYILGGYYFKRYYSSYPTSKNAENALYFTVLIAIIWIVPRSSLDQESTKDSHSGNETFYSTFSQ
jgi:outer membrane protein assembly factor BamD